MVTKLIGTWAGSIVMLLGTLIFFLSSIAKRQLNENAGVEFSQIGGTVLGLIPIIFIMLFFNSPKIALVAGLIGCAVGGLIGAPLIGDGSYEG